MKCVLFDARRKFVGYVLAKDDAGLVVRDMKHYLRMSEAAPSTWLFQELALETLLELGPPA